MEGRQKKIRRYRAEDVKPLPHIITTESEEEKAFFEGQNLLNNSQYNYMQLRKTTNPDIWKITDSSGNTRHIAEPKVMLETIKEITQTN